jgi:hypothetical protein
MCKSLLLKDQNYPANEKLATISTTFIWDAVIGHEWHSLQMNPTAANNLCFDAKNGILRSCWERKIILSMNLVTLRTR